MIVVVADFEERVSLLESATNERYSKNYED